MRRLVKHKTVLNAILRDERLSPNRRMLGELLSLWVDSEDPLEKRKLFQLIEAQYGSPDKIQVGEPTPQAGIEKKAHEELKAFFSETVEEAKVDVS